VIINLNIIYLTVALVDISGCNITYRNLHSRIIQVRKSIFSNTTRQIIEDIVSSEFKFENIFRNEY